MLICVGQISKPHGVLGQVKIQTYTSSVKVFLNFKKIYRIDAESVSLINFTKLQKLSDKVVIGNIENINSRNEAEKLRLTNIYVDRTELKNLKPNEYYYEDLIGLVIQNIEGISFGKVTGVFDYGAGTFLELQNFTIPFSSNSIIEVTDKLIIVNENWII